MKIDPCATAHPALKNYFGYCLYKSAHRLRSQLDEALEIHGLIAPQFGILTVLNTTGGLCQADISSQMGIDKATVVKLIDGLESQNLVIRIPQKSDRRMNHLQITSKGKSTLAKGLKVAKKVEKKFLSPLTLSEQDTLRQLMPRLLR
jgi:DNA-binding MarR family transcriptional regulator